MKKLRKLMSIICVVSLILSLVAVGFGSMVSAYTNGSIAFPDEEGKPEVEIDCSDLALPGEDSDNVWLCMHLDNGFNETVKEIISFPGNNLPKIPTGNNENGMYWLSADGEIITTVPDTVNENYEVHIYAVYPTKTYDFSKGMDDIFLPNGYPLGSSSRSIVNDPLGTGRGSVLKISTTVATGSTAQIPLSTVSGIGNNGGFKLNNGSTYTITMDVYQSENNTNGGNNNWNFYYSALEGVGNSGNKTAGSSFVQSEVEKFQATNEEGNHHWATITHTFTADVPKGRDYLLLTWSFGGSVSKDLASTIYVDNIKIVETGDAVDPYITPVIMLDAMGGTLSSESVIEASYNELVELPVPTKNDYLFAGWTINKSIAAGTAANNTTNMVAAYAPTMSVVAKGRTMTLYAIWAPKLVTYTFGTVNEEKDKKIDFAFNKDVTTEERTTATGTVSTFISLEDCDEDGDYELKTNVNKDREANVFKANLAKSDIDGTKNDYYILRENVTYRVTMKVKVAELKNNLAKVGVTRCYRDGFGQVNPEGSNKRDYLLVGEFTEVTNSFVTVSKEFTTFGMFNTSYSGNPNEKSLGGAYAYKDGLAFLGFSGVTYIDYITVEALSYNEPKTLEIIGEGTVDVDYENKTVTVKPATGYKLSANSIEIKYNYHGYDYATYKTYDATPEQIDHVTAAYNKTDKVFAIVSNSADGSVTYSYNMKLDVPPCGLTFIVNIIKEDEISSAVIAKSVRTEKVLASGDYRSAGLRFRSRVLKDDRITEIGFIAIPTDKLFGYDTLEFLPDGKLNYNSAASAVAYSKEKGINALYNESESFLEYQLIITGLTIESGERDLRGTSFTVVSYIKYDDNGTTKYQYSASMAASWNTVWNSYSQEIRDKF